jgi:hypothetical protein
MSYDDENDGVSTKAKLITACAVVLISGIYHHFVTNNTDIVATVRNTRKTTRLVQRRSGKRTYWTTETDYFIETDQGTFTDESDMWELELIEGDEYGVVEVGHTYKFHVNHDNLTENNNVLQVTEVTTASAPAQASW